MLQALKHLLELLKAKLIGMNYIRFLKALGTLTILNKETSEKHCSNTAMSKYELEKRLNDLERQCQLISRDLGITGRINEITDQYQSVLEDLTIKTSISSHINCIARLMLRRFKELVANIRQEVLTQLA